MSDTNEGTYPYEYGAVESAVQMFLDGAVGRDYLARALLESRQRVDERHSRQTREYQRWTG